MKLVDFTVNKLSGISKAIVRFFMAFICLLTIAVLNIIAIETTDSFEEQITSLIFGVFCFLCAQILCERFGRSLLVKGLFYTAAAGSAVLYYLYILSVGNLNDAVGIRTTVFIFILLIGFLWIPSLKRKTDFPGIFLNVFKAFFTSAFFSGIIFGGISLIIAAIDTLLTEISSKAYTHAANIIWIIFAPMLLLSLIPVFAKDTDEESLEKALRYPKFLEILLMYVLIPLISAYTLVLVIYMGKTVILSNWGDNLLEPMILSYLIAVLALYLLVKRLDNAFTRYFKTTFPLILTAVALFQIASSLIKIRDEGIVLSRYFILAFSLYSVICGILLFIKNKRKAEVNFIAWLAMIFAVVCISPYVGSFDVSAASQSEIVRSTLIKNNMLSNGTLVKNNAISEEDKNKITNAVKNLHYADRLYKLEFLPSDFDFYSDFNRVFGFDYNNMPIHVYKDFYRDEQEPITVSGYDYLFSSSFRLIKDSSSNESVGAISKNNDLYVIKIETLNEKGSLVFYGPDKAVLMSVSLDEIFDVLNGYETPEKGYLEDSKLTFDFENNSIKTRLIFKSASIYEDSASADIYILVTVK